MKQFFPGSSLVVVAQCTNVGMASANASLKVVQCGADLHKSCRTSGYLTYMLISCFLICFDCLLGCGPAPEGS